MLGVLCVLTLGAFTIGGKSERTFKKTVASLDTASVNKILVTLPGGEPVTLNKAGNAWNVTLPNGGSAPTGDNMVENALSSIAALDASQLVSRKEDDWPEYKVDSAGTRVEVFSGNDKTLDLILGKFEYKQTGMMSYVRDADEDDIYLVKGLLDRSFNRPVNDWRNKTILNGPYTQWMGVSYVYQGDSSFQIMKGIDNNWMLPDSTLLDKSKTTTYMGAAASTNGTAFNDTPPATSTPAYQMVVQTTTGPVEVKAFREANGTYIITSTLSPGSYFSDADGSIVKKLFVGLRNFQTEGEE